MEKRNYTKLSISRPQEPQGDIYRSPGNRGPGDKPWPEAARAACPHGCENAAFAAFPWQCFCGARGAACCAPPGCPPVCWIPGFWFDRENAAKCRVSAAFLGRRVRRRLLRAALLSPCRLTLLILIESAL